MWEMSVMADRIPFDVVGSNKLIDTLFWMRTGIMWAIWRSRIGGWRVRWRDSGFARIGGL